MRKYQAPPTSRSTVNRNALSLVKWPVIGHNLPSQARFYLKPENRAMRRSRSLVFPSEHLNYNMLKADYGIFAKHYAKKLLHTAALSQTSNLPSRCPQRWVLGIPAARERRFSVPVREEARFRPSSCRCTVPGAYSGTGEHIAVPVTEYYIGYYRITKAPPLVT